MGSVTSIVNSLEFHPFYPLPELNCNRKKNNMKLLLILVFVALASAGKRCSENEDCAPDGCCYGIGQIKWCHDFLQEGSRCMLSSRYGCGCVPGLTCTRKGSDFFEHCYNVTMAA